MKKLLFLAILLTIPSLLLAQTVSPINYWAKTDTVSYRFTRPTNVTAYTAQDVVTSADTTFISFTPVNRRKGLSGMIMSAFLEVDTANTSGATFRLYLFRDTSSTQGTAVTRIGDNAAFTWLAGYQHKLVATIDFALSTAGTGSTSAYSYISGLTIPFISNMSEQYLYGQLVATGAYTPKNGGKFYIKLWILKD